MPYEIQVIAFEACAVPYEIRVIAFAACAVPYEIRVIAVEACAVPYEIRVIVCEACAVPWRGAAGNAAISESTGAEWHARVVWQWGNGANWGDAMGRQKRATKRGNNLERSHIAGPRWFGDHSVAHNVQRGAMCACVWVGVCVCVWGGGGNACWNTFCKSRQPYC